MPFNIIKYYESKGIEYHLFPEKNVGRGWVNISCPFPECDDPSWHLGFNFKKQRFNCYICGNKGKAVKLIREIERCSFDRAQEIFKLFKGSVADAGEFRSPPSSPELPTTQRTSSERFEYPGGIYFLDEFPKSHIHYLVKRRFEPNDVIKKYHLKATGHVGDYNFRIIFPYIESGKVVSFTSRDITGEQGLRYIDCPVPLSIHPPKETLYNIDRVKQGGKAVVVEGVFDVMRIGDGAVASSTTALTERQIELIQEKELSGLMMLFDAEKIAIRKARRIAENFTSIISDVKLCRLDSGDPDSALRGVDIKRIRRFIDE